MKKFFKTLWIIIVTIFGFLALLASNKSKEVKQLKRVIDENKRKEKQVEKEIAVLEKSKTENKKDIDKLKKDLEKKKKEISDMEDAFNDDNVDDAVKFLREFSKG